MNTPVASRMNTPLSHQIAVGLHSGVFVGETPPSAAGMLSSQHSVDSRISSRRLLCSSRSSCQPRASQLNTSHLSRLSGSQFSDGVDNDMTQDYAALLGDGQADYAALLGTQQVDLQAEGQVEELAQVFSQTVSLSSTKRCCVLCGAECDSSNAMCSDCVSMSLMLSQSLSRSCSASPATRSPAAAASPVAATSSPPSSPPVVVAQTRMSPCAVCGELVPEETPRAQEQLMCMTCTGMFESDSPFQSFSQSQSSQKHRASPTLQQSQHLQDEAAHLEAAARMLEQVDDEDTGSPQQCRQNGLGTTFRAVDNASKHDRSPASNPITPELIRKYGHKQRQNSGLSQGNPQQHSGTESRVHSLVSTNLAFGQQIVSIDDL